MYLAQLISEPNVFVLNFEMYLRLLAQLIGSCRNGWGSFGQMSEQACVSNPRPIPILTDTLYFALVQLY